MSLVPPISVAIETTCRAGGVAVGSGDALVESAAFDSSRRAATQLVARLDTLLGSHGVKPLDVEEIYVAAGPGSFTGTRVGVTVARTLGQISPALRCVAVPTVRAVAENARDLPDARNLAVILDAKHGRIFAGLFASVGGELALQAPAGLTTPGKLLAAAPRPLHVIGEGLGYHDLAGPDVTVLPEPLWLPRVEAVWSVGRRLAAAGRFVAYPELLPIYTGRPQAVRQWQARQSK